jgi:hypothetical protein
VQEDKSRDEAAKLVGLTDNALYKSMKRNSASRAYSKSQKRQLRKQDKKLSLKVPDPFQATVPNFVSQQERKHPYISHRYITTGSYCITRCSLEQFKSLANKLRMLCGLDWKQIESSPRETNGFEMLPTKILQEKLPAPFADRDKAMVFRFNGGRIVGVRNEEKFYILFIDHDFSFYDHGS